MPWTPFYQMAEFFASDQFHTVLNALNSGFLVTLELFCVTLLGALPLGLIISFGSMSRFRPFGWLASQFGLTPKGHVAKAICAFRPIRLVTRLLVWLVRGTPLVPWPSCSTTRATFPRFTAAASRACPLASRRPARCWA